MTEDTSPENLRKFLESDDPALVRMGISMAKGTGVEITVKDLVHFLKNEDIETIKTGVMLADEAGVRDEAMEMLCKALGEGHDVRYTAGALGEIGDARAVEPLIKVLRDENVDVECRESAARALGEIGDARAVEPLMEVFGDWEFGECAQEALAKIGEPAVDPLIEALDIVFNSDGVAAADTLGMIGDASAIESLEYELSEIERWDPGGVDLDYSTYRHAVEGAIESINLAVAEKAKRTVETLKRISNEQAVEPLIKALEDHSTDIRVAAVKRLGDIGDKRAVESLIKEAFLEVGSTAMTRLDQNRAVSMLAVKAAAIAELVKLGWKPETDEGKVAFLIVKGDWEGCVNLGKSAIEPLIKVLGDGLLVFGRKFVDRSDAARVLGKIGDTRAVEPLIEALKEFEKDTHLAITEALGKIGDARAVEPLIGMLLDGWHEEMQHPETCEYRTTKDINYCTCGLIRSRASAAKTLGEIGDERAVEPLITALRTSWRISLTRYQYLGQVPWQEIVWALGAIGDERAVEPLIKTLQGSRKRTWMTTRSSAVDALGKIGDTRAVKPLIKALRNSNVDLATLTSVLENFGEVTVEPLINAFGEIYTSRPFYTKTRHSDVRKAVVRVLGVIGDKRAVEPLIKALKDEDVCNNAAEALGNIGDKRAVKILIKALEDGNPAAAAALGRIGDARAVEPLITALENNSPVVREYAVQALDALGWKPDTEQNQFERLLASSGLRFSDLPIEAHDVLEDCKLLLSQEKIMNLEQEEFVQIVKKRSKSLETIEIRNYFGGLMITPEDIIGLLSESSAQARWIVACGVVEISCYDSATIDKINENPINIFGSEISNYPNLITKTDRDEIIKVLKRLPLVLVNKIGKGLSIFAVARSNKDTSAANRNRKMMISIFADPELAKIILDGM